MKYKPMLAAVAFALAAAAPAAQPAPQTKLSAAAERVRADVEFLSHDLLEGRDSGSRGYDIAAAYVAAQFRAIGLQPGGTNGSWYQQVPFRRATHAAPVEASLAIGNDRVTLTAGSDFAVRPSLTQQARTIDAPLVFAGHGISDAAVGIDDYAGIDARGKIVVVLEGAPEGLPSEVAAHLASWKSQAAAAKGAVGIVEIAGTGVRPGYDLVSYLGRPLVDWIQPAGGTSGEPRRLDLSAAISSKAAARMFVAAGQNLTRLVKAHRSGSVRGFDLPARLRLSDRSSWEDFSSPEVIGLLPGADPVRKAEHVILMGHLDHLGMKPNPKAGEDAIFNGALDNASGIATMLEAAREFAASPTPPRRSVLFIANTGEERGLRGADYFAANPTVPRDSIVGVVDLDMPMLLYPFTDITAFGGEHSTIARSIADAAAAMGVKVAPDPMPEEAIFVRSDHYRFVTRGIPAILLMTGYGNGGEAKWKEFFATAYHKPSDDVSQAILWDQGARYAELNYRIARALADSEDRPLWYQGDYFGDVFAPGQRKAPKQ
ncbi:M20/M25/M40 family metallo-hydrolase [Sphingomonas sabuli]|uniref:M20/M25/M40 family metallo-hydrolase n=1 Tax=Sphingomonas sabuli TaxID=2764186 RepID=A0A7G9L606_9SPHN|nr:M20/M25/M40 family metallo-hydrolase [Sphingomonas sabuli]QNM84055.1 M20/M25/M40 family metallo-hydrolase [Sphingomonas sabuli]